MQNKRLDLFDGLDNSGNESEKCVFSLFSSLGWSPVHTPQTELRTLKCGESVTLVHWFQRRALPGIGMRSVKILLPETHFSGYRDCNL